MLKVLIPTDFSANANKAIDFAITVFGPEAKYTLVHSYEVPHSGATMLISIADILEKDSHQLLNSAREEIISKHPDVADRLEVRAVMGQPSVAIKKLISMEEHDLVVMGTKGASGLKQVFVGSVAANTMTQLDCPVIAVPEDAPLKVPKKIVFAVDDAGLSSGRFPARLVDLTNLLQAEILVLNVVPAGELHHVGSSGESVSNEIPTFEGVKHSVHFVPNDDVKKGIVEFVQDSGADMLAMVTRKNDFVTKLFGTSNTKQLMMSTRVPLVAFH